MEHRQAAMSSVDDWVRRRPWVVDTLLATALTLVLGPTSLALLWGAQWQPVARAAVIALVLLGHLSVAARRVSPVPAYAVCCLVMLVLVIAPEVTGDGVGEFASQAVPPILLPSALVFPVALYAVAAYSARPWPLLALVVALVGAVLTAVRLASPGEMTAGPAPEGTWPRVFVFAALVAAVLAAWGLGRFRSVRAAYVTALEERAVRAEQHRAERAEQAVAVERARIAREMHDVVAHSLAVIVRQAEGGRLAAAKDPRVAVQALSAVSATGREALADMRTVLGVLRRDDESADDAPQPTVDDVPALVERVRATGVSVALSTSGTAGALDRAASLAAYRVVQEALTNVVKHAGRGAVADVRLDWQEAGLDIAVVDHGRVEDVRAAPAGDHAGQGLVGMRERVELVGGRLTVEPGGVEPGRDVGARGFAVLAHLPTRSSGVHS